MILYLGGRAGSVKGPIVVTAPASQDGRARALPDPSQLQDANRLALQTLSTGGSYQSAVSDWKFIATPVRASSQTCLDCHSVSPGELVGVTMYGYTEARR